MIAGYAELHCLSNFSFQRGASSAAELFERARDLGYGALAITDECTLAGIVRAFEAARTTGVKLIVGAEITLADETRLVVLCRNRDGYEALCRLITRARRAADKGDYHLIREDLADGLPGTSVLWLPGEEATIETGAWLRRIFTDRLWLAVELHAGPDDAHRLRHLLDTAEEIGVPAVAAGDVHMHVRGRRALQDTLTAIRHRRTVAEAGDRLFINGERHLRTPAALTRIYPRELLDETVHIADACQFSLDELKYHYPAELVPEDHTPTSWLHELTTRGMRRHWPRGAPKKIIKQIDYELALIAELGYEAYFLTVDDIVRFARSRGILCQGRGSAANSAVCYALGITAVDPERINMLVERFISAERDEPPDIDVDFEHSRREEVIQYIYDKYGRDRAALAATVICYRPKSALCDVGRALGLAPETIKSLTKVFARAGRIDERDDLLREYDLDPADATLDRVIKLARQLLGFPRHLSQHVGGFVISDAPLSTLVPVENAAMADRTVIQWDKDDLDALGLIKVDVLALGMLTCIRKCFELVHRHRGRELTLANLPRGDTATYRMIQRADTLGVFQVESRAQMAMLPRHRPENFYDLVVQVAIVRPGPIQGDMVHPYLKRRHGEETVDYPSKDLKKVLERTLGVPLFQEQVMQIAIVAAGYSPGEADQLRRSMAAWRRYGDIESHRRRIIAGMLERGYRREFAEQLFEQLKGFGSYGFPESHAASFAGVVYASCWLKCHEPAAFACALLNSQPLGFYAPAQIVNDAKRHGIEVREVDVCCSLWDCTLEADTAQSPIRLGLRQIRGFRESSAHRIVDARARHPFVDVADLCARAGLDRHDRKCLANAGALKNLAGDRHRARWIAAGVEPAMPLFDSPAEREVALPPPSQLEDTRADYRSTGLTLGVHPLQQLRTRLARHHYADSQALKHAADGERVRTCGLVTHRQRPMTAAGVTFVTLEDEYGLINLIVWKYVAERFFRPLTESSLMGVAGHWQTADGVSHLIAQRLEDLSSLLEGMDTRSRDFQ